MTASTRVINPRTVGPHWSSLFCRPAVLKSFTKLCPCGGRLWLSFSTPKRHVWWGCSLRAEHRERKTYFFIIATMLHAAGCLSFFIRICDKVRDGIVLFVGCDAVSSKTINGVFCCAWAWLASLKTKKNWISLAWQWCRILASRYLVSGGVSGNSGFCNNLTGSSRGPNRDFLSPFSLIKWFIRI